MNEHAKRRSQYRIVFYVSKQPKNDSHDFRKYKTLDVIIIDAITEL